MSYNRGVVPAAVGAIPAFLKKELGAIQRAFGSLSVAWGGVTDVPVNLTALAGLTGAADEVPYFTAVGAMALAALTPYGRTIVACATAAAARAALGLGSAALNSSADFDAAGAAAAVLASSLQKTSNLSDLASASTARTNLGLGSLAVKSSVVETDLSLSNVTTADVSTTKHGLVPVAPNDATKFLDGTGAWSVPAGSGGVRPTFPSISNLELRLSARDSALTFSNGLVTSISDISGNGRNSSTIAGAQRPRYYPKGFNGWLPCLSFNGLAAAAATYVSVPTGLTLNDPMSVVIVMQNWTGGTPSQFLYRGANGGAVGLNNGGSVWSIFNGTIVSSAALFTQNTAAPLIGGATAHPCVRMDIYNRASSIISCNGNEIGVGDPSNTAGGITSPWVIGAEGAAAGIGSQAGRFLLYEILFFSKALGATERALLNTFYQQDTLIPFA